MVGCADDYVAGSPGAGPRYSTEGYCGWARGSWVLYDLCIYLAVLRSQSTGGGRLEGAGGVEYYSAVAGYEDLSESVGGCGSLCLADVDYYDYGWLTVSLRGD